MSLIFLSAGEHRGPFHEDISSDYIPPAKISHSTIRQLL